MKVGDALKRIDSGWVRKPTGFRVRFDIFRNGSWMTDTSPDVSEAPLDSDVTAWRLAWKLAQAGGHDQPERSEGDLANITVVDDQGCRFRCYITNDYLVYHPQEIVPSGT